MHGETYGEDCNNVVAVAWMTSALATAEAEQIVIEAENKIELRGLFMQGVATNGHGVLRPDGCGVIRTAAP